MFFLRLKDNNCIIPKIKKKGVKMFSSFSKKSIVLSTAVVLSFGLVGCGGGGSNSSGATATATKTGVFADAPVEGLSYSTATQSGFTNAQGQFKYKAGETVTFKLGTLTLGKGKAGAFVTPYTISDNNTTAATNIAMVLQNFDGNRSNTQVLNLSKLKDFNFTADTNTRDINISAAPSALQNKLATLLSTASFQKHVDDVKHDLITETKVKQNMDDYIHKYETEHQKVTTPIPSTTGNIVPYTQSFTQTSPDGKMIYTEKLGAIGKLQAEKISHSGTVYGIQFKLKNGVTSIDITDATKTDIMEGNSDYAGHYSGKSTSDFKAGTEHLVISSSKYGNADCINTYKTILPYNLTANNDIGGMYFDNKNIISTTCPSWVNVDDNSTAPQNFKMTTNYILTDDSNTITKVSEFIQVKL